MEDIYNIFLSPNLEFKESSTKQRDETEEQLQTEFRANVPSL